MAKKDNTGLIFLGIAALGVFFLWRNKKAAASPDVVIGTATTQPTIPGTPWASLPSGICVDTRTNAVVPMDTCTLALKKYTMGT